MSCCYAAGARLLLSAGPVRALGLPLLLHHAQDPGHDGGDDGQQAQDDGGGHDGRDVGSLRPGAQQVSLTLAVNE